MADQLFVNLRSLRNMKFTPEQEMAFAVDLAKMSTIENAKFEAEEKRLQMTDEAFHKTFTI